MFLYIHETLKAPGNKEMIDIILDFIQYKLFVSKDTTKKVRG